MLLSKSTVLDEQQLVEMYYVSIFFALLIALLLFRSLAGLGKTSDSTVAKQNATAEFKAFQLKYVLVYLFMMGADWLQGPYVYALYTHYGYDINQIGVLFIVGFGSSLLFGTVVGSMADMYGRKKLCILFGILYSLSCITKHFKSYVVLLLGRFLGGISTSILFSSFESWLVHEHHSLGYSDELLGQTFSICTSANGIVAIASGVVASLVREQFGPVAPFDVSLLCLLIGTSIVVSTWKENTGDASVDLQHTLINAYERLKHDRKIVLLGLIQSFFEGAMYIFVFMWTPALESTADGQVILHGWIFAAFMICTLIGSGIFQYCIEHQYRVEKLSFQMFVCSAASLLLPALSVNHTVRLLSFCLYEVCVGMFWPCLGFMRSKYVPEEVRATTMNFFRIPLNIIVCIVLGKIGELSQATVFGICVICLSIAVTCQWQLWNIVFEKPEQLKQQAIAPQEERQPLTNIATTH